MRAIDEDAATPRADAREDEEAREDGTTTRADEAASGRRDAKTASDARDGGDGAFVCFVGAKQRGSRVVERGGRRRDGVDDGRSSWRWRNSGAR